MNPLLRITLLVCLWVLSAGTLALAAPEKEKIESDISSRNIAIESNFTGQKIVIFGTIENSQQSEFEPGLYDVVVAIRGPKERIVSRRKSRVAGIWINRESHTFANAPGYYALLSGRELKDITSKTTLDAYSLGFDSLPFRPLGAQTSSRATGGLSEFRSAVVRIKQREGLYIYNPEGVIFVGRNLFRATVDLPANVPVGQYATDVYLLREGDVLSHNRSQLTIDKQGFERFVYSAAFDYPLLYGIIAVLIAVSAGLLASALTRRD
jgi:uncharacterized protein (TIGR02186 family)